jgi:hypothetical protein
MPGNGNLAADLRLSRSWKQLRKTNSVWLAHLKRSSLQTGWINLLKRKRHKTLGTVTFCYSLLRWFLRLRCHKTNSEVFFKSTFQQDYLLTFDWFLSAPGCFWKKRRIPPKLSLHPHQWPNCARRPSKWETWMRCDARGTWNILQ